MAQTSIIANNISVQQPMLLLNNISFVLNGGEHLLITGNSGSGKTTFAKALAGKLFCKGSVRYSIDKPKIILVDQHYYFKTLSNTSDFYYQQRYHSVDSNDALTVEEELLKVNNDEEKIASLLKHLQLAHRKNDSLLHLSSGEHKRFQLIKAFLQDADVFIFDSPFTGLDNTSREILRKLIDKKSSSATMIVAADIEDAPLCITHVAELDYGSLKNFEPGENLQQYTTFNTQYSIFKGEMPFQEEKYFFNVAVKLENINVAYADKQILSNINWKIGRGESWLLKGVNGSGKSTLISLITGDHPQAYSNKVFLFDKKRGSGESIWDIKKRIGYVSPELHWYFDKTTSVYNTVASGFFDTIGVYKKLSAEQHNLVLRWLTFLNIGLKAHQQLFTLSTILQRLTLLARALVKDPPLLILDEPCQGLDEQQVKDFVGLIDELHHQSNKTLIYVSHYDNEIPKCIDNVMSLEINDQKNHQKKHKETEIYELERN